MLRGLDVSSVQGLLPVDKLGPEYRFLIHKAVQGNDGKDPFFERNIKAWEATGRVGGAYHFVYPLPHLDPKKQAQAFFEGTAGYGAYEGQLPPMIDAEWPEPARRNPDGTLSYPQKKWGCTEQQISDFLAVLCAEMHRLYGTKPMIYTYDWWWASLAAKADVSWAAAYGLVAAWYRNGWPVQGEKPKIFKPWTDWLFWQFDGNNGLRLPNGVDSDFDVFNGTEEDLKHLTVYGIP